MKLPEPVLTPEGARRRVLGAEEVATEALRLASLEDVKETGQAITML